jgi:hypothetical protein
VRRCSLVEQLGEDEQYGRIQVARGENGRDIRMVGLRAVAKDWNARALILDATGDAKLLRAVWPDLIHEEDSMGKRPWQQLPRPEHVRLTQIVDRSISKFAVAVEGKNEKELARKADAARKMYAALLLKAMEYGGADVAAIIYKSTKEWIEKNCYVPSWLKLMHFGDVAGTNVLQEVRALFVVGRTLPAAEDITRQAEAMFGRYIAKRGYVKATERIPIVPDASGNNSIEVTVWRHPNALAERLRRQVCEAQLLHAVGRARAGQRKPDSPLDIHLWTDVPLPELGPVEPMLWSEVETDLDGLMLAAGGVWLACVPDAVQAYKGLFKADALRQARKRGSGTFPIGYPIENVPLPRITSTVTYQRRGRGPRPARACFLADIADPRAWLEERLGPLVRFEAEGMPVAGVAS